MNIICPSHAPMFYEDDQMLEVGVCGSLFIHFMAISASVVQVSCYDKSTAKYVKFPHKFRIVDESNGFMQLRSVHDHFEYYLCCNDSYTLYNDTQTVIHLDKQT